MMWKIQTTKIREKIYYSKISNGLPTAEEQKGCRKGTRGTRELLYIDQHLLNEGKARRKNLVIARIDNKKANDRARQIG